MTTANKTKTPKPSETRVIGGVKYRRFATFTHKQHTIDAMSKLSEWAKSQLTIRKLNRTTYAVYRTDSSFEE